MSMSVDFHANDYVSGDDFNKNFKVDSKVWDKYVTLKVQNTWKTEVTMYLSLENLELIIEEAKKLKKEYVKTHGTTV